MSLRRRSYLGLVYGAFGAALLTPIAVVAQTSGGAVDPITGERTSQAQTDSRSAATQQLSTTSANSGYEPYKPDQIVDQAPRSAEQGERGMRGDVVDPIAGDDLRGARALPRRAVLPSEFEAYVSDIANKPLRRFGANLLVPDARDFTAPPTTTVPPDYRINPGDELIIGLTGSVQADSVHRTVDAEGRIFMPNIGAITVGGTAYRDVQSVIAAAVSRQYRDFTLSVAIGKLHGITVYVTGFAATPGSYTISSLSTLVNAVLAAGGPSTGGSFRSIQVRRNGRLVSDFDLYDLLLKGDKSADVTLENGDVIYIAPTGAQVAVIGSVNAEAVFEARANETLQDMLLYAGGVNTAADDTRVMLLDSINVGNGPKGWQQLAPAAIRTHPAMRGEVLRVLSSIGIARPLAEQSVLVTISGEVAHPGHYYIPPGSTLDAAIAQAGGLTAQAFPYGAVFTRERIRQEQQRSFARAVADTELLISEHSLTAANANSSSLTPTTLTAVRDLVTQLQARKPEGRLVFEIPPDARNVPGDLVLENNDSLFVPPQPVVVGVFGSVPSPASFQYRQGLHIRDYLAKAGGVQKFGDRSKIVVIRANGSLLAPKHGILNAPALPGDLVYVPINPARGEGWAKLRDIGSLVTGLGLTAATAAVIATN